MTTREMLEKHPDTVKRFLAALRQGWQDALDPQNEEQAVQVLLQMDRETPAAVVRRQLAVTRELMLPAPGAAFGTDRPSTPGSRPRRSWRPSSSYRRT